MFDSEKWLQGDQSNETSVEEHYLHGSLPDYLNFTTWTLQVMKITLNALKFEDW